MSDFLADCAERIIVLGIVHRRIINRFRKFILWLGVPLHRLQDTKPNEFCRVVSEFALEYRTTRERVIQQLEKKANHRERNKTRGKKITEVNVLTQRTAAGALARNICTYPRYVQLFNFNYDSSQKLILNSHVLVICLMTNLCLFFLFPSLFSFLHSPNFSGWQIQNKGRSCGRGT